MVTKAAPKKNLSTLKRARQDDKKKERNLSVKTKIKTYIKKFETALASKNPEEANSTMQATIKVIGSAASKGIIHRNTASRKISRLMKKAHEAFRQETAPQEPASAE